MVRARRAHLADRGEGLLRGGGDVDVVGIAADASVPDRRSG
jgi:hypothetical protein